MSAIQAIRSITNWLYWQPPIPGMPADQTSKKLLQITENATQSNSPNLKKLKEAVTARQQTQTNKPKPNTNTSEYWTPSSFILPESPTNNSNHKSSSNTTFEKPKHDSYGDKFVVRNRNKIRGGYDRYEQVVPVGMAVVAAVIVRLQLGNGGVGGIESHVGGSMLVDVVNSSWLQVILAGVTWYLIGLFAVELVATLRIKSHDIEE